MFWDVLLDLLSQSVSGQAAPECSAFFYCSDFHKRVKKENRFAHVPEVEVDKTNGNQLKTTKGKRYQLLIKGINQRYQVVKPTKALLMYSSLPKPP